MHPVRFCGRVLKEAEMNYHPAEKEVLALLLLLKTRYAQLAGRTIHMYTRFSKLEWSLGSKKRIEQLLQAGVTSFVDLEDSLATVTPPTKGSSTVPHGPSVALHSFTPILQRVRGLVCWIGQNREVWYMVVAHGLFGDYPTGQ
ncbi:hypothetical protein PHMEG_00014216 [Phytophthora megakarya]|uniref:Reverse transcriptase RNase H-like domain-containing protein n=1 Tax=Phytophthora megakarya TaxID=4795 RepID=A0A225W4C3_9STRA|nr:hypothetical protein PHMEG_00014216 [Phytophthora megakarya]